MFDLRSNASLCLWVTQVGVLFDEGQVMQPQIHTERDGLQASSVYLERDQTKKEHVNRLNDFTLFIKVALCPFFDLCTSCGLFLLNNEEWGISRKSSIIVLLK